jgi:hypothetical protein
MAECNIDKSCFDDVKVCVKVNSVNGIKPNADGEVDIDEHFVTTNTPQTIIGTKDFANTIKTNGMNHDAMLTTMNGLKIDTAPTVINKSSIKWNDKEQNEVSSIEVSRPANTKDTCISLSANTITEWGSNEKASIEVHAKAGAISHATAPTPSSNATGNEIVTAEWVIDKGLANDSNVVHTSGNETITGTKTFSDITISNKELRYKDIMNDWSDTSLNTWCNAGHVTWFDKTGNRRMHELVGANGGVWKKVCYINENQYFSVDSNRNISFSGTATFNGTVSFNGNVFAYYNFFHKNNNMDITTNPSKTLYTDYTFKDKNNNTLSFVQYARNPNGIHNLGLFITDSASALSGVVVNSAKEFYPFGHNAYSLGKSDRRWANVYSNEINAQIIGTKYIQHYDGGYLSTLTLPECSGKAALQERTRANAEPVNRTLLYECAGGLDIGDITLSDMYTKYNALVIVYSNDDGGAVSTYYLDCAELDIRRQEAGSGTFLLVDGHSYWACTGASTATKFVHSNNNGLRIHKIYGLAEYY